MDLSADAGTLPIRTAVGGPDLERELSLSNAPRQTESGGTILLQVLEFKTFLLEAVEELHIRRDAETRFEDQISKLVLEKQELEWQKESLQHQTETMANQHTESLTNVKKQAKIRGIEEEKGKHQLSAELKDKEINSLKEGLKSLQLFKYSLEKKSSELEQKLALQSRSKDSHLNQLGEVEKRFSALSRQCAMVKQAHEKLEQNVDEAMRVNRKLVSANEKQETTINSLKQELEELNNKLIKAKVSSVGRCETHGHSAREQHVQQLHQRLLMETEMNKKLRDENAAERTEKQEVMRSLHHAQQLLLSQTQSVSRVELELQTQREEYQALKRKHEVMREKSEAAEDKMARLMEDYTTSKTIWDKQRTVFLERIKSEQQDLQAVTEAYDQLHQKHTELSSQAILQAQHIYGLETGLEQLAKDSLSSKSLNVPKEDCVMNTKDQAMELDPNMENADVTEKSIEVGLHMETACVDSSLVALSQIRDCSQSHSVSTLLFPTVVEGSRGEGPLNESSPGSALPGLGSLQGLAPSHTRDPDCLVVTEAVDKMVATGATGGQEVSIHHQQSECNKSLIPSNPLTSPPAANNRFSLCTLSGATGGKTNNLNTYIPNSNTSESDPALVSDLISTNVSVSDDGLLIGEGSCVSATLSVSGLENRSVYGDLLTEGKTDEENRGKGKQDEGGKDGVKEGKTNRAEEGGRNGEQGARWNREEVYRNDVKEGGSTGEERGQLITKTADRAERRGDGERSTEDAGETETKDRAEGERRDGEEREEAGGRLALHTPETELPAQTSADNGHRDGEKSKTPQAIDSTDDSEPPLAASQPSDCSHTLSQKVSEINADTSHVKEGHGIGTEGHSLQTLTSDEFQTLTHGPLPLSHEVPHLSHDGVQAFTRDVESLNQLPATIHEKTTEENPSNKTAALSASQPDSIVKMKELDTTDTQSQPSNPSHSTINMTHIEEKSDIHASEECVTVSRMVEPQALPLSQEISEQENELLKSLATDEKRDSQSKANLCEIARQPVEKSYLKDARPLNDSSVNITVENVSSTLSEKGSDEGPSTTNTITKEEIGQEHMKNNKIEDAEDAMVSHNEIILKLPDPLSLEDDVSPETGSSKCHEKHLAKEMLFGDIDHSSLPNNKKYGSSFEWASAQRKKGSPVSEPNTSGSGGFPGRSSPSTLPTFLKGKQNKDPLAITRASDLLNASSVSGPPASSKRDQQGEWNAIRETFRETATADPERRAPLSTTSFPVSTSSSTVSRLSWQAAPGSSRTPTPGPGPSPGPSSGSDCFPSSSQESEDQQSSFRAQISKIEQFLCAERLRLPKRRRTDN